MVKINTDIIKYYNLDQSPLNIAHLKPKLLKYYEIKRIPPAEPQVIITDIYKNFQKWYDIPSLIHEQFTQTYVCYFNGLYVASLSCAINTVELILKYELIRQEKNPNNLTEKNFTLGYIINNELNKMKLERFKDDLTLVNDIRIGIYHYNTEKLNLILKKFKIDYLNQNTEYWKFTEFIYDLLKKIIIELYDSPDKYLKHLKEGLDEYKKINKNESVYE